MAAYAFFECTMPTCRLRFPLDTETHKGQFCPLCGGKLHKIPSKVGIPKSEPGRRFFSNFRIRVVLDNLRSAFNVGGIFRTADGVGVEHLYLCGITPTPSTHSDLVKTALGAETSVPWTTHKNAPDLAKHLQTEGYFLLGLERVPGAVPIQDFSLDRIGGQPIALVIGHERAGVDPGLLSQCDEIITLIMAGSKASLNVAVAFGAAVYWLTFG